MEGAPKINTGSQESSGEVRKGGWPYNENPRMRNEPDHEVLDAEAIEKIRAIQERGVIDLKGKDGIAQNEILGKMHVDIEKAKEESKERAKSK